MAEERKLAPKAIAYILILRWVIALIFFANGAPKFMDPAFGAHAHDFFASLQDDLIFAPNNPYIKFFKIVVVPNAYLFAFLVKYAEVGVAIGFFLGFPLKLATMVAIFLHLNYLNIASLPTFIYLNIIMIVSEMVVLAANRN